MKERIDEIVADFLNLRASRTMATDQLLAAIHLMARGVNLDTKNLKDNPVVTALFRDLKSAS